jgi:hypothetical protein
MSGIWTQIIKMRSRYWWPWAEFIRAEALIIEWSELCPDFDYFLAFVFPLKNITEISLLVADWRVKHRVMWTLPPCLCFKAQILKDLLTLVLYCLLWCVILSSSTKQSDNPVASTSGERYINFASRMTYKTHSDLKVTCPYSAFMNRTYVLWDGWAWLYRHPSLPLNFALWRYTLYKNVYFRQMAMLEFTEPTYRLSSRNFYVYMKL